MILLTDTATTKVKDLIAQEGEFDDVMRYTQKLVKERIGDVKKAIKAVKEELIAKLPKMKRAGRVVTKNLEVTLTPMMADELVAA